MIGWLASAFWLLGATFCLLAAIGLLRMPDLFTRMQAGSKASTLGMAFLLAGTALDMADGSVLARAVTIAAFIMLTTPVAAHAVARAAYLTDVPLWSGTAIDERRGHVPPASASAGGAQGPAGPVPGEPPLGGVR
jgi:multicomponent Na+:H+ antiporter subunit G